MTRPEVRTRPAIAADADFLVDMLVEAVNWPGNRNAPGYGYVADDVPEHGGRVEGAGVSSLPLRHATPAVFHQRHIGRVL